MESVIAWGIMVILMIMGFFAAVRKIENGKARYNAENDEFFRFHDLTR